jgi:hypothetical protein
MWFVASQLWGCLLETILTNLNDAERLEFYDVVRANKGELHLFIFAKIPNLIDKLEDAIIKLQQRPNL